METNQIYDIVNSTVSQAIGDTALTAVDTQGLISLGNVVLSSSTNVEAFLNTLVQRIGRTIYRFRSYQNKLKDLTIGDMEYGCILQKLRTEMPEAELDPTYSLVDGESIDMFKVSKPKAHQKLFVTRTPYMFKITIQRETLKEAFLSPEAMGSFISLIYGEVRNAIELSLENLGRLTISAAMAETENTQKIHLVTDYNTENDLSGDDAKTAATFLTDPNCLRYAIFRINNMIDMLQDMSVLYNPEGVLPTFTNAENMKIRVLSAFQRRLETVVEYAAFHDQFTKIDGSYSTINFWQSEQTPSSIDIERPSDGTEVEQAGIVAVIHDKDALGIYQISESVLTSPVNAAGQYFNVFYHLRQSRFVDRGENILTFVLD